MSLSGLPKLAHYTHEFQRNAVLNKAVLAAAGLELPNVMLVRNPQERREKISYAVVALFSACLLAPGRAWALNKLLSRLFRLDRTFIALPAKALSHLSSFRKATGVPVDEKLRRRVINARAVKLGLDMMMDALIFANMGWIRNWFGKQITGTGFFTGEIGAVSNEKLKGLYGAESEKQKLSEKHKKQFTTGLAITVPLLISGLLRRSLIRPASGLWASIRRIAPAFDYHRGILFSIAPMIVISLLNDIGEIISARSSRERTETLAKKTAIETIFFGGDFLWLALLAKLIPNKAGLKIGNSVAKTVRQVPAALRASAATRASWQYLAGFCLNTLTLCAVILGINRKTVQNTQAQAKALQTAQTTGPSFQQPRLFANYFAQTRSQAAV
jgi:hypothetical protein